ncbi:MAG: hypothetical protein JXJ04_17690 [Spirochaetales bacterium]|nr:hypothetical protein [Spirochaetales bacterium]
MIKKKIIITTLSIFCTLFSCSKNETIYDIKPIFKDMRDMTFSINPTDIGIAKKSENQVYAVIMETGYEEGIYSLRCFAEGSISLLFSNGGGMIGIGEHQEAREKGLLLINESNHYFNKFKKVDEYPLPKKDETIFYLLTFTGIYSYAEKENNLGNNMSALSPLFYKAQDVITQALLIEEKQQ